MNYIGDTFIRNYSAETDTGDYIFESGDILKVAFVDSKKNVYLKKTIQLTQGQEDVDVVWTAEEMRTLEVGNYIVEAELTTSNWTKTIQEQIQIHRDYIVGE